MLEAKIIPSGQSEPAWRIVERHLPLAEFVARSFRRFRVPIEDLESEGRLGLYDAALRYDPAQEVKFSTYATWWVLKRVSDAVSCATLVRLPRSRARLRQRARVAEQDLRGRLGREPSADEISSAARIRVATIEAMRVEGSLEVSLDDPVAVGEEASFGDRIPQTLLPQPDRAALDEERTTRLTRLLAALPSRERDILSLRFGLDGSPPQALAEVAGAYGLSRERVHQIEREAIRRIRRLWPIR